MCIRDSNSIFADFCLCNNIL